MAERQWLQAYVLHRRPYRETSYIVDCFTLELGKVSAVAKGVRNSRSDRKSLLQPFQSLRIQLTGRSELKNLVQAEGERGQILLQGTSLFCGLYVNELLNRVMPAGLVSESLYSHYQKALGELSAAVDIELTLRRFEFAVLKEMGLLADWTQEGITGEQVQAEKWYAYSSEEGIVPALPDIIKNPIPGYALLAAVAEDWTPSARKVAKHLNRLALLPLVGDKPLKSRELFVIR
ncbi:DNA repair protein RecO [Alteromonas pelagimontana]|uniref:DNA repair protein RecO n=1 Tax=Alteromonas pelagimontana TaxID=1858656 RepID=A0A6M4MBT2_9ALTE|nr:DNA repair protein RecO [Alteromonas pelagimontana]QJR80268.1 DNA repair protein RecO [Alteromonas pelagimontana]